MRTYVLLGISVIFAFFVGTIIGHGFVNTYLLGDGRYDIVTVVGKQTDTEKVELIVMEADGNYAHQFVSISADCWKNRKENDRFLVRFDGRCYWFKDQASADK